MEFTFELICQIDHGGADQEMLLEQLGEVGCDDAFICMGVPDRFALIFQHQKGTWEEVYRRALQDVHRVLPAARLINTFQLCPV